MSEAIKALMHELVPVEEKAYHKVTIVGTGQVGMAIAYSILQQVGEIFLILNMFYFIGFY